MANGVLYIEKYFCDIMQCLSCLVLLFIRCTCKPIKYISVYFVPGFYRSCSIIILIIILRELPTISCLKVDVRADFIKGKTFLLKETNICITV